MKQLWHSFLLPVSVKSLSRLGVLVAFVIGGLDLAGWALDIGIFKSLNPLWTSMRIITPLCLLMSAAALTCLQGMAPIRWKVVVSRMFGVAVGAVGLLTVASYLVELQTGQEWSWARYPFLSLFLASGTRMAVITAILFSLFGCVLLLIGAGGRRAADAAHASLLLVAMMTYMVLAGYLFHVQAFYEWLNSGVALNTGVAFCALCVAAFCTRPDTWLMNVFAGDEAGAVMARRLLPALLLIPLVIGWLRLYGERTALFESEVGVALVAVTYTLCFLLLVWLNARAVNRTDRQRRGVEEALRESEERFRLLFQQAAVGIKRMDPDGHILEVNDRYCDILGYEREDLLRLSLRDITHPEDLLREETELVRLLSREIPGYNLEKRCFRRDGDSIWVRVTSSLPSGGSGVDGWWISVVQDITRRKQAEESLQRTAEELARSNMDLEQFAYAASHDLQEPLRAVAGFMSILRKQYRDKLDADARDYIDQAVEGAERMQALINDLLTYSRVGRKGGTFQPVDMQTAVDAAVRNLQVAIDESGAVVTSDALPTVTADASQMTQLLQNLIGNAIKFRGERQPVINIRTRREDRRWIISVSDNGIGIEPQYYDRIFLIFQRLHSRTQYPGTGIGLAVCKKIVERHSGEIRVDSTPGGGSTFYFTMPNKGESS